MHFIRSNGEITSEIWFLIPLCSLQISQYRNVVMTWNSYYLFFRLFDVAMSCALACVRLVGRNASRYEIRPLLSLQCLKCLVFVVPRWLFCYFITGTTNGKALSRYRHRCCRIAFFWSLWESSHSDCCHQISYEGKHSYIVSNVIYDRIILKLLSVCAKIIELTDFASSGEESSHFHLCNFCRKTPAGFVPTEEIR